MPAYNKCSKLDSRPSQRLPGVWMTYFYGNKRMSLESEVTVLMDSLFLLGTVNVNLSIKRRELIKPDLNSEYKKLCASTGPITDKLFGDDLAQQVKNIAEANKIRSKISSSRGGRDSTRGRGVYFRGWGWPFSAFKGWRGGRGGPYHADKQFGRSVDYWNNPGNATREQRSEKTLKVSCSKYGGRLAQFAQNWEKYTSDPSILDTVKHCHIDFESIPPNNSRAHQIQFSVEEKKN